MKVELSQRAAFRAEQRRQFEEHMRMHLRARFPGLHATPDDELRRWIREAIAAAERIAIRREYDLRRFLEHARTRGLSFVDEPPFAEVLHDPNLDGAYKMDLVDELDLFTRCP